MYFNKSKSTYVIDLNSTVIGAKLLAHISTFNDP